MSEYTLGKIEYERHAESVMTSLAAAVVRYMGELDEANARIAVLEEEQKILVRERGTAVSHALDNAVERDTARTALDWAVEWLDTLTGRFPEDGSVGEMFDELAKDRLTNAALDAAWNEVGWTQAVAKEVRV